MEPVSRVVVDVTFLEMLHPPKLQAPDFLPGWHIELLKTPSVALYRKLHEWVGRNHCWWMRQVKSDLELERILREPRRSVFLLKDKDEIRGFFEFELQPHKTVNLAYFGLVPEAIGRGIGKIFLAQVVKLAWSGNPRRVTVNTCTADHARALTSYLSIGFRIVGVIREDWDIPLRLNIPIPQHLV
ncbi:GNAT family N-acetyltransferase [Acetobacter sp. LMG 1627]|uniref:GNAT family N-acetyltransferase n=2 Tax=Acetobacter conturbans TaxID=1737472 RepID=A0ABX0JZ21_9PROT|nr:GNAT family N-acetyltransferase [Acetobacter conturbans]